MSDYVRHTWKDGEVIDAEKMNNLEAGIAEAKKEAEQKATTASYKGTLSASGWSDSAPYTQQIAVPGILFSDEPFIDIYLENVADGTAIIEAWSCVGRVSTSANDTLTAYCYEEKPEVDIPIILKVVR